MARLRRVDCAGPGIRRRRAGRGFVYLAGDERVTDPAVLARIRALAIPPAWTDVWICPPAAGHIQAVGTDAAGRRQYRYHDDWRTRRDREKFDHILDFAGALPALRSTVTAELAGDELSHWLGNTPAVCRSSYVDPWVIDRYQAGVTVAPTLSDLGEGASFGQLATQAVPGPLTLQELRRGGILASLEGMSTQ